MQQQDDALEQLERSVHSTKHIALQINEEADLHNRWAWAGRAWPRGAHRASALSEARRIKLLHPASSSTLPRGAQCFISLHRECADCRLTDASPPPARPSRLLDDLDEDVEGTSSRLAAAQRRLKLVMRRSSGCKASLLLFLVRAARRGDATRTAPVVHFVVCCCGRKQVRGTSRCCDVKCAGRMPTSNWARRRLSLGSQVALVLVVVLVIGFKLAIHL